MLQASDALQRAVTSPSQRSGHRPGVPLLAGRGPGHHTAGPAGVFAEDGRRGNGGGRSAKVEEMFEVEITDEELMMPPILPRGRSISEPAPPRRRALGIVAALDAVDAGLPFSPAMSPRAGDKARRVPSTLVNLLLCLVSLLSGCLVPALVDLSRTATAFGPMGAQQQRLPYNALSVLQAEASFNVGLGVVAIAMLRSPEGFEPLWRWELHRMMLPLTLVYCLGDLAALFAIGSGGGPLYVAVSNSRLIFAAAASQAFLGRRQSVRQWALLAEITAAAAVYAVLSARAAAFSSGLGGEGGLRAATGTCWAVAKALLSGTAAVLTESRYKRLNLWHANTLLKGQSLAVALAISCLYSASVEDLPLCGEEAAERTSWCVDRRGWDHWTWAVLIAEIGAGWLSVAVLTRMSAVAKFVCKTATAPTLYLTYCAAGLGGLRFETPRFAAVVMIVVGIFAYTTEPHVEALQRAVEKLWVAEYPRAYRRTA